MKQIVMFSFKKAQVRDILSKLNMEIQKGNVVHKETGEIVECYTCGKKLKEHNVGNVLPGTNAVLCDDPSCFATYCAEKKLV